METSRSDTNGHDALLIAAVREALDWNRQQVKRLDSGVMDDDLARELDRQVAQNHEAAARSLVEAFRADQDGDSRRAEREFAAAVALSPSVLFQGARIEESLSRL
jgi:hypothetical protein